MVRENGWICPNCETRLPIPPPRLFSTSNYASACLACHGVGTFQAPRPEKLILHPEKPLISGAMYSPGFFPKGYLGKPFNGGYDLVQALAVRYHFNPATTPWNQMTPEAQQAFLFGDPEPMPVTYNSRNGRVRETIGKFPGFYGWIRDWDVGGTYTETVACPTCGGARLRPEYLAVGLLDHNIYQLSQLPLVELANLLETLPVPENKTPAGSGQPGCGSKAFEILDPKPDWDI